MAKETSVDRKESTRWVVPQQTSYDGNDWGEGYDDDTYGPEDPEIAPTAPPRPLGSLEEDEEEETTASEPAHAPPLPQRHANHADEDAGLDDVPEPAPVSLPATSTTLAPAPEPESESESDLESHKPKTQVHREPEPSQLHASGSHPDEDDSEIEAPAADRDSLVDEQASISTEDKRADDLHEIYGIYEERPVSHPYSTLSVDPSEMNHPGDYSDSTASLSTGRHSMESGTYEPSGMRNSLEYQSSLHGVPEDKEAAAHATASSTPTKEADADDDDDVLPDDAPTPTIPPIIRQEEPNTPSPTSQEQRALEAEILSSFAGHTAPRAGTGVLDHHRDVSMGSTSSVLGADPEIAELYEGTSAFLDRPISMYQNRVEPLHMKHAISDMEVRKLLTPVEQQEEFEGANAVTPTLGQSGLSETYNARDVLEDDDLNDDDLDQPRDDRNINGYHDEYRQSDNEDELNDDELDELTSGRPVALPPLRLPSEMNRENRYSLDSPTSPDLASAGPTAPSPLLDSEARTLESTTAPAAAPTAVKSPAESEFSDNRLPEIEPRKASDAAVERSERPSGHAHRSSEHSTMSATSGISRVRSEMTGASGVSSEVEASSSTTLGGAPASELGAMSIDDQPRSAIASKVKRPPAIDLKALFNKKDGDQEACIEQLRTLRIREAEHSSGLNTWLLEIYGRADPAMNVYSSGQPPSQPTPHEGAGTKVTNAVHESTNMAKEKLGRVSEKSRSFFAKGKKLIK